MGPTVPHPVAQRDFRTTVADLTEIVTSSLALEEVLELVARGVTEALGVYGADVYEHDEERDALVCITSWTPDAQEESQGYVGTVLDLADNPSYRRVLEERTIVEFHIDDPDLPHPDRVAMERWGEKSIIEVGLVHGDQTVGCLSLSTRDAVLRLGDEDKELLFALAAAASVAIANARVHRLVEKRNARLMGLLRVSQGLAMSLDADQIIVSLEEGLDDLLSDYACRTRVVAERASDDAISEHQASTGSAPLRAVGRDSGNTRGILSVPLATGGQDLGSIEITSETARRFSTEDVELVKLIANQAAVSLQNAHLFTALEERATTDAMTGLANFRAFSERFEQEVARAHRYDLPLSLIMIDIDDFKQVNDTHGHQTGDDVLREIAELLVSQTRNNVDIVTRYGGEEFCIILPNTGPEGKRPRAGANRTVGPVDGARAVAERIRCAVAGWRFSGCSLALTVSLGIVGYPEHPACAERLLASADAALYEAKRAGKNRVVVSPPEIVKTNAGQAEKPRMNRLRPASNG